mgnify:CR=1 FL=1
MKLSTICPPSVENNTSKDEDNSPQYQIDFDKPQSSVTPGQSVVFYQGDVCLGGGIINSLIR